MAESSRDVAAAIAELIHRQRPEAAFLTYITDHTDGIMSESEHRRRTGAAALAVLGERQREPRAGSEPGKIAINLAMSFVDYPWRYAHVPQPEIQLRLYQNMAHGGPPAFVVVGPDGPAGPDGLIGAKPIFHWHEGHEDFTSARRTPRASCS